MFTRCHANYDVALSHETHQHFGITKFCPYFPAPHIDISLPSRSADDSALAFTKSRSEYLATLQKNYFV